MLFQNHGSFFFFSANTTLSTLKYVVLETNINLQVFQHGIRDSSCWPSPSMPPLTFSPVCLPLFLSWIRRSSRKRKLQFLIDVMLFPAPVCLPKRCLLPWRLPTLQLLNLPCYLFTHPSHSAQHGINYFSSVFPLHTFIIKLILFYNYLLCFSPLPTKVWVP